MAWKSPAAPENPPGFEAFRRMLERELTDPAQGTAMLSLTLLSALLLAAATVVFNIAGTAAADGALWAVNVCSTAPLLCQMPYVTWVPAVALGASWAVLKATSGIQI